MEMIANFMMFMSNIKEIVMNIPALLKASLPGSGTSPGEILSKLKWEVSPGIGKAGEDMVSSGIDGITNVMKEFGEELAGPGVAGMYDAFGISPSSKSPEANFIMVPVSGEAAVRSPMGESRSGSSIPFGKDMPKSVFRGDSTAYEPLRIITKGVDEVGNIRVMLKGNCPNCGIYFGKGGKEEALPSTNPDSTKERQEGSSGSPAASGRTSRIGRASSGESMDLDLSTSEGMSKLSDLARDKKVRASGKDYEQLDPRLGGIIQGLEDQFPGKKVKIHRGSSEKGGTSQHSKGKALDVSIPGVKPAEIFKHLRKSVPSGGVGYYPNQPFVHVDVRDKPATWVDFTKPGEKSISKGENKNVFTGEEAESWIDSNL
jgi:hypothetical protein